MSGGGPPEVPGGRSAEERERARQAREARRGRLPSEGRSARTAPSRGRAEERTPPEAPARDRPDEGPRRGIPGRGRGGDRGAQEPPRHPTLERPAAAYAAPPPRPAGGRRGLAVLAVLVLGVTLLAVWALGSYYQPFTGEGGERVRVTIPAGASVADIATILERQGVISSPFFFETRARLTGRGTSLRPGAYTLRRGASNASVLDLLAAGPPPDVVSITVPEGRSRREVAPIVSGAGLGRGYLRATADGGPLDPTEYGAPEGASLEGFLFPSTYELKRDASAKDLVRRQTEAFEREARALGLEDGPDGRSPYEVLTVASMVEREAQVDRERPLIASVIYNRLEADQPLQIDATVRYASGNWSSPIKQSELASTDPYNTYVNSGLPPGPIGSPGRESLAAAINPADTDFRFYVVKPGTCGEHAFSEDDTQWERDKERYEAERAARGGRSPTDC